MRVPPGVAASDFRAAIAEWQAAVGKDWVFVTDEDVDLYRDAYSLLRDEAQAAATLPPIGEPARISPD
jgi:(+)-pinoresinol hydroxylase